MGLLAIGIEHPLEIRFSALMTPIQSDKADRRRDRLVKLAAPARRAFRHLPRPSRYVVRFTSMTSQAFSASANVLKGDPPTRMAVRLRLTGRQEATKPDRPWRPGPLLLSLLITNEKPRSLAIHISNSSVAGAMRLKCRAIPRSSEPPKRPQAYLWGRQPVGRFSPGQGALGHRPE